MRRICIGIKSLMADLGFQIYFLIWPILEASESSSSLTCLYIKASMSGWSLARLISLCAAMAPHTLHRYSPTYTILLAQLDPPHFQFFAQLELKAYPKCVNIPNPRTIGNEPSILFFSGFGIGLFCWRWHHIFVWLWPPVVLLAWGPIGIMGQPETHTSLPDNISELILKEPGSETGF